MNNAALLNDLQLVQDLVMALVEPLDDTAWRTQYHPDLSPLGWHLGHCTFTECYWLQEVVLDTNRFTLPVTRLYNPEKTPKPERGKALPERDALIQWTKGMQALNADVLDAPTPPAHTLMEDSYLLHFLIQHYSQHYETMLAILTQRALREDMPDFQVHSPLAAKLPEHESISVHPGHYRVGGAAPQSYDNELPSQQATLGPFDIACRPVSNSEYLAFMHAGGYDDRPHWSEAGWKWLSECTITHPDHWRNNTDGHWHGIGIRGAYELDGNDVLHGISYYEAEAYANWAGGQLPHEHQWEVACRLQHLEQTGRAWEWCKNEFYPYAGYQPFPYDRYSNAWLNNRHYTLRGGSFHTRPAIKRVSFRNFYTPDKRHIFAGLRLVYDKG